MGMAFNNLKTLKLKELTGKQFSEVGNIYSDLTSKSDFRQISEIKNAVIDALTFTGGMPYPDSIIATGFELSNSTQDLKPSTLYTTEANAEDYMCVLNGISAYTASGTSVVKITLSDGSSDVIISAMSVSTSPDKWLMFTEPIYFTEDLYITVHEIATNTAIIDLSVGIVSRGGNPQ